jgi:Flp pilus assembly protein TadB
VANVALFLFIAAATVAVFAFLSVAYWVTARADERKARDRYALLRKIAEQPVETAQPVIALGREEDARLEQLAHARARQRRRDGMQSGAILVAIATGLSLMLYAIPSSPAVWTVGLIPGLVGVVLFLFACFSRPSGSDASGANPKENRS